MKYGLPDIVIENMRSVFAGHYNVDKVILFGSRAKGNYKPGSDIDLAIRGVGLKLDDTLSISGQLENLNLPYKVDLVNYETINDPDVIDHIKRMGIEFYKKQ